MHREPKKWNSQNYGRIFHSVIDLHTIGSHTSDLDFATYVFCPSFVLAIHLVHK